MGNLVKIEGCIIDLDPRERDTEKPIGLLAEAQRYYEERNELRSINHELAEALTYLLTVGHSPYAIEDATKKAREALAKAVGGQ